jgi:hypothetical protein
MIHHLLFCRSDYARRFFQPRCSISCLSRGQKDEVLRQGCKAPHGSALLCKLDFLTTQYVAHLYVILIVVPVFLCAPEIVGVTQGCKTP